MLIISGIHTAIHHALYIKHLILKYCSISEKHVIASYLCSLKYLQKIVGFWWGVFLGGGVHESFFNLLRSTSFAKEILVHTNKFPDCVIAYGNV